MRCRACSMCRWGRSSRGFITPSRRCEKFLQNQESNIMSNEPSDFREKLFSAQDVSPNLRAAYQKDVQSMANPALTPPKAAMGAMVVLILVICAVGIVRAIFVHHP